MALLNGSEMMIQNTLNSKLEFLLKRYSSKKQSDYTLEDSLYHDLGIFGDDADEFFDEYSKMFNVNVSNLNLNTYFPGETDPLLNIVKKLFGRRLGTDKVYSRISIQDLIVGINSGIIDKK